LTSHSLHDLARSTGRPAAANANQRTSCKINFFTDDQLEDEWGRRWCAALAKITEFRDWTGVLERVDSGDSADAAYIEIRLNWGFSAEEKLPENSPIFQKASNLKQDAVVKVSGTINPADDACVGWSDVGHGDQPVHFTSIAQVDNYRSGMVSE
jgi:hypothetical protein